MKAQKVAEIVLSKTSEIITTAIRFVIFLKENILCCKFNSAKHFNRGNKIGGIFILYEIISVSLFQYQIKMKQS